MEQVVPAGSWVACGLVGQGVIQFGVVGRLYGAVLRGSVLSFSPAFFRFWGREIAKVDIWEG